MGVEGCARCAPQRPPFSSLRSTCSTRLLVGIFGPQRRPTSAPRRPSSLRSTCSIGLLVDILGPQRRPTSAPRRPPSLRSMSSSPELLFDIFAATSAAAQGPHDGHYSLRAFSLLFFTRSFTDDSYPCTCPSAVQDMGGGGMVTRYQDRTIKHTISTTPNKQKRISTPDRTKK